MLAVKNFSRFVLISGIVFTFPGCWVARPAHDRPLMEANVGTKATLVSPTVLYRDLGGRLHLTANEEKDVIRSSVVVERLPAGTAIRIKDVIYRIIPSGRWDYYVIEIATPTGVQTIEIPNEVHRPKWEAIQR